MRSSLVPSLIFRQGIVSIVPPGTFRVLSSPPGRVGHAAGARAVFILIGFVPPLGRTLRDRGGLSEATGRQSEAVLDEDCELLVPIHRTQGCTAGGVPAAMKTVVGEVRCCSPHPKTSGGNGTATPRPAGAGSSARPKAGMGASEPVGADAPAAWHNDHTGPRATIGPNYAAILPMRAHLTESKLGPESTDARALLRRRGHGAFPWNSP